MKKKLNKAKRKLVKRRKTKAIANNAIAAADNTATNLVEEERLEIVGEVINGKVHAPVPDAYPDWSRDAKFAIVMMDDYKLIEIGTWAFGK